MGVKIIKTLFPGIKSMYSTLLSSFYSLFSLWYPTTVSSYTLRHVFWLHGCHCTFPVSRSGFMDATAHFLYPTLALVASLFSPGCVPGPSLQLPTLPPTQDVRGVKAEAPTPSQKLQGEETTPLPLHKLLPCSQARTRHTSHMFFSKGSSFLKPAKHWTQQQSRN